jgi:DNA repair protein RecO (recombination protein O)
MAQTLRAVVLRRVDVGEADRILSLLTAERGRVEVRVPSARKSRKRFGGVDLYTLLDADIDDSRRRLRLRGASVVASHPGIREDIVRLALAGHVAELTGQAAAEEQESPELLRLAVAAFTSLDVPAGVDVGGRGWARAFELKLAHVVGVRPSLLQCASCGASIDSGTTGWSPVHGGVLVGDCRRLDPNATIVSRSTLRTLHTALHLPLAEQATVDWSGPVAGEARTAMIRYIEEHVGRRSRAREFLHKVSTPLPALVAAMVLAAGSGCAAAPADEDVRIQGWLFDTTTPTDATLPITGASLNAYDDDGEILDEGSEPFTEAPGFYRVSGLVPESAVHLEFLPPAVDDGALSFWVPTLRSGRSAADDLFVDDGVFHLRPRASLHLLLDELNEGAARAGLRLGYDDPDPDIEDQGGALVAFIATSEIQLGERFRITDSAGVATEVWYRSGDGLIPSAGVDAQGEFMLAGLAAGPVDVERIDPLGGPSERRFRTHVVEDGLTVLLDFVP